MLISVRPTWADTKQESANRRQEGRRLGLECREAGGARPADDNALPPGLLCPRAGNEVFAGCIPSPPQAHGRQKRWRRRVQSCWGSQDPSHCLPAPRGSWTEPAESKSNHKLEAVITDSVKTGRQGRKEQPVFAQAGTQQTSSNTTTTAAGQTTPGMDTGPLEAETMLLWELIR